MADSTPVSPEELIRVARRGRKNAHAIRDGMRVIGQNVIAELIGESETTVSRSKGDLERCAAIIAAVGLKVVPVGHRMYSEERIKALNVLAKIGLDTVDTEPGALDED